MYHYQYTTLKEQKQRDLQRHQFFKNRHFYFFKAKPIKLLQKHKKWRKTAGILKLSKTAKQRLWMICFL